MREFFRSNGVYAYECGIPQTRTDSKAVFFVSGLNGDEFGQYDNEVAATSRAVEMARHSEVERKKFDR